MLTLKTPLEKGSKKLINAWAFYDWANSVYSLVISSAIFPIYYGVLFSDINTISFWGYDIKNTAAISFVTASAFVIVALMSPLLSGIADYIGNKKKFMKIFVYMGSLSCVGLYWFELDTIYLSLFFYFSLNWILVQLGVLQLLFTRYCVSQTARPSQRTWLFLWLYRECFALIGQFGHGHETRFVWYSGECK